MFSLRRNTHGIVWQITSIIVFPCEGKSHFASYDAYLKNNVYILHAYRKFLFILSGVRLNNYLLKILDPKNNLFAPIECFDFVLDRKYFYGK